jgi:ParB family chromosome partitioning protein
MKSTAMNGEYRNVPIATLTESPTNPRKRFDEKALEELAATFKTQGVLEPLLVRELEERNYQVVIGARRLRAAKIARRSGSSCEAIGCRSHRGPGC